VALASTFPRQITASLGEWLVVPMIFFLLFSYLPMRRMRQTQMASASAGCGQFLLVRAAAYRASGGHTQFPATMHDGIELPRLIRRHGGRTDLFDGTDLLTVRMYRGFAETWRGFAKNAYEGLGSVGLLVFLTLFHAVVYLLPWPLGVWAAVTGRWRVATLCGLAIVIGLAQRVWLNHRFRQPAWVALLHPIAIVLTAAVQWWSLFLFKTGRRAWRGRSSGAAAREQVILVDEQDREVGQAEKLSAHRAEGRLHRAFSVLLFDADGRTLLQRRAAVKYHFAGRWANACCGHPRPGENTLDAARRRLHEELGIDTELSELASFTYRAEDAGSGLTEHEIDHVLVGRFDGDLQPNPLETDAVRWVDPAALQRALAERPDDYAPWVVRVWQAYADAEASATV
jgi:isopentenyl-diphosphate delta-isomerase